jgi:heptosyltransferase III
MTILLSRTDSIGDVVLTLPLAGLLKSVLPECRIVFLCAAYTRPVVDACQHVDAVLDWTALATVPEHEQIRILQAEHVDAMIHVFPCLAVAELMRKAGIKTRIGTRNRLHHWWTCNRLVALSRNNSALHEAVLNSFLLRGLEELPQMPVLTNETVPEHYGLTRLPTPPTHLQAILDSERLNCILHPKSQGSAPEWNSGAYQRLLDLLPQEKVHIILTGTESEGRSTEALRTAVRSRGGSDLTGATTLTELIALVYAADGLVASSTGPLHIAAALGKYTLGLFSPVRPVHPERWRPLGNHASVLVPGGDSADIQAITPQEVAGVVLSWVEEKQSGRPSERSA